MNLLRQQRRSARTRLLAGMSAVMMTLSIAACGGAQSGDEVTLQFMWWGNPPRHKATMKTIKIYEKKNPNVNIEPVYTSWDGYWDKLATQMAGGNAPDIMQMDFTYLSDYATRGTLLDLGDYTGKALDVSGISQKLLEGGKIGGGFYALPWTTNIQTLTVDATDIKKSGVSVPKFGYNWDDLRTFAKKLNAANGPNEHALSDMSHISVIFEVWLRDHGKAMYTANGQLGFTKQDLHDYWTYWQELRNAKITTPPGVMTPAGASIDQFSLVRGVADMDFMWSNQLASVGEFVDHDLALVPPPVGQQVGLYLHPGIFLCASARTDYPTEAAKFINFLVTNKEVGQIVGTNRGIPADKTIREMLASKASGLSKKTFDYHAQLTDELGPTPPVPPEANGEIGDLFDRMGENVAFGRISVDKAVDEFFSRAQRILSS